MDAFIESLTNGLLKMFGGQPYLTVLFVSMLPMVEVRGAIPIAIRLGLPAAAAYAFSAVSALIICPILIFCLRPVLDALKKTKWFKKLAATVEDMFRGKADGIEKNADGKLTEDDEKKARKSNFYRALGLYLFVAIPLPMTGVWTGSAIAAFIKLQYRYSIPAIILGNFTAAGIIALLTYLLGDKSYIILIVLAVFMAITVMGLILSMYRKAKKRKIKEAARETVYTDKQEDKEL